jgi:hypothetical protein
MEMPEKIASANYDVRFLRPSARQTLINPTKLRRQPPGFWI